MRGGRCVVDNDGRVQRMVAVGAAKVSATKQGACVLIKAVAAGVEAVDVLVALRGRHGRAPDQRQHPRERCRVTLATNGRVTDAAGLSERGGLTLITHAKSFPKVLTPSHRNHPFFITLPFEVVATRGQSQHSGQSPPWLLFSPEVVTRCAIPGAPLHHFV